MRKLLLTLTLVLAAAFAACGGSSDDDPGTTSAGCIEGCEATMAAACDLGPGSQAECESDCRGFESGACAAEYSTLQTCSEGKSVTCSAEGFPSVTGCATAQNAFVACLTQ